jgi:hypothetical protein
MANLLSVPQVFSTTLNVGGGINNSQTSGIVLTSVTGLPTDGGIVCFDWASTLDTSVAEYIEYTGITGNTLTGVTRGAEGISAKAHSNGAVVAGVISQAHIKRLKERLDGTDTASSTLTSPKILTSILDTNGNEEVKFTATGSAVNEITVTNAATGNAPQVTATGDDTDIDLTLKAKGAGKVKLGTALLKFPNADGSSGQFLKTDGSGVLSFASSTGAVDGWTSTSDAWTYASASTINVPSGAASLYQKGDRIKFTQTTVKYFVVVAVADTLLTVAVNSDYTVANAAISAISYSHVLCPVGYPTWFNFATTHTGFSANPSGYVYKYKIDGSCLTVNYSSVYNPGTSNASGFSITIPVTSDANTWTTSILYKDNTAFSTTAGSATITGGQTTINFYKDVAQTGFTSSGTKGAVLNSFLIPF